MKRTPLRYVLIGTLWLLLMHTAHADTDYKPYLHEPALPDHPEVRLFGQYGTDLFPGAATYTFQIVVPPGVNGMQPDMYLHYSSLSASARPGILGAGWSLSQDMVYREVNGTPDDTSDDEFILRIDNREYKLEDVEGTYHTEVDTWMRIKQSNGYWTVTKQNGVQYRFGSTDDSRLQSNAGHDYDVEWYLDTVTDTYGNQVFYSYEQNPYADDVGAVYLQRVTYNSDRKRTVHFTYENSTRPDRRRVVEEGNLLEESRRLINISVSVNQDLIRTYSVDYTEISPSQTAISTISEHSALNNSRYTLTFAYHEPNSTYTNQSNWSTPVAFTQQGTPDTGVRLVDLNNDGYADVVRSVSGGAKGTWINDKREGFNSESSYALPLPIVDSSSRDQGVRFADINQDGYPDLLSAKGSSEAVYRNTGAGWEKIGMNLPSFFVDSSGTDQGVRLAEVNGDRNIDIIESRAGTNEVYLHTGSGWSASAFQFPVDIVNSTGGDQGVRLADINGDGLVDVLVAENIGVSTQAVYLNNGTNWQASQDWALPAGLYFTQTNQPDTGVRLIDVNGDGLIDLTQGFANSTENSYTTWLNTGSAWQQDDTYNFPEAFVQRNSNSYVRLADINGDGATDLLYGNGSKKYTELRDTFTPPLLQTAENAYGGNTAIEYTKSTKYNNTEDGLSRIGFNIYVVENVTKDNNLSGPFSVKAKTNYSYAFGKYSYEDGAFRGFGETTEELPGATHIYEFYQDDPRRGKQRSKSVLSKGGSLLTRSEREYNWTLVGGVYNVSLTSTTKYDYDGLSNPRIHNVTYRYNIFGNPQEVIDHGDIAIHGDERVKEYEYALNTQDWIINKLARSTIYDADENKIKETKYYYDNLGLTAVGERGSLTKTEEWSNLGNHTFTQYDHDAFGNRIAKTDSRGNTWTYRYDELNIYKESEINPLGHIKTFGYDERTGNLLIETSNGISTRYEYDEFGRIKNEIRPLDSSGLPTKEYTYIFDGKAPETISIDVRTTGNDTENTRHHFDGFGNLIQQERSLQTQELIKNVFYDAQFRIHKEQIPYFATKSSGYADVGNQSNTTYSYDALSRPTTIKNPDGTNKTVAFRRENITAYDENGNRIMYALDVRDRITEVHEYNIDELGREKEYVTHYSYDENDNLISITDNENNEIVFSYDSLGRKVRMVDPDMGAWTYVYDTNGNLIKQTDARGETTTLQYDRLNRLINKSGDGISTNFTYDTQYQGTLGSVAQQSTTISYEYDERYRITEQTTTIAGESFERDYIHDSQSRVISDNEIDYIYSRQGLVEEIPGYLEDASHNAFGSVSTRYLANGVNQTLSYDVDTNRITDIISEGVQNLSYTYDGVGNILTLSDQGVFSSFTYDSLHRLTEAQIAADRYSYAYSSLGNIMKLVSNNESKRMVYGTGPVHAPAQIIEGRAGADLVSANELETSNTTRVYEFGLINDNNETISTNFSISFEDGTTASSYVTLNTGSPVVVLIQKNYSAGDNYSVDFAAYSNASGDEQQASMPFGISIESLDLVDEIYSNKVLELVVKSDIKTARNIGWSCSQSIKANEQSSLGAEEKLYVIIENNYTTARTQDFACNVTSTDGNRTEAITITTPTLDLQKYDVLYQNRSMRIVAFDTLNEYYDLQANITTETEGEAASQLVNITSDEKIVTIIETNYTRDGEQQFKIELAAAETEHDFTEQFTLQGVLLRNYLRQKQNRTNQILAFDIINAWNDATINWSISDPNITNTTPMDADGFLAVVVEGNYDQQDEQHATITAKHSIHTPIIDDQFPVRPLEITSFQNIRQSFMNVIAELVVTNHLTTNQTFDWTITGGVGDVDGSQSVETGSDVWIISESTFNTGTGEASATVNASNFDDTATAAVVPE